MPPKSKQHGHKPQSSRSKDARKQKRMADEEEINLLDSQSRNFVSTAEPTLKPSAGSIGHNPNSKNENGRSEIGLQELGDDAERLHPPPSSSDGSKGFHKIRPASAFYKDKER